MKCTILGFKKFTGKDGRKWCQLGCVYKDMNAFGGSFASTVMCSDENDLSSSIVPGEIYDIDFDNRGQMLSIERCSK